MHTLKYPDDGDEDTTEGITRFHYNSDLSGDVIITRSHKGVVIDEVEVPGKHLIEFIANFVQSKKIAKLEQMEDALEILGIKE